MIGRSSGMRILFSAACGRSSIFDYIVALTQHHRTAIYVANT
jgi:hypothetical protein